MNDRSAVASMVQKVKAQHERELIHTFSITLLYYELVYAYIRELLCILCILLASIHTRVEQ